MRIKNGNTEDLSKRDAKCFALIEDYLARFKEARREMQSSKAEIERLKASSRRRLSQIDAVLSRA